MTRICIRVRDEEHTIHATLEPGHALLVGRAPDPSRIDWKSVASSPVGALARSFSDHSRMTTLAIQSGFISANHLLVLRDNNTTLFYDFESRNGSWLKLLPKQAVVLSSEPEISVYLAALPREEPRMTRPYDAEWAHEEDFGPAVVRAVSAWLVKSDVPMRVSLRSADNQGASGFLLGKAGVLELQEYGTMPVSTVTLREILRQYIHDQNARFMQLKLRVSGMIAGSAALRRILIRTAEAAASGRRLVLLGPPGTGKELLARSYHGYSPRRDRPFVRVNCAASQKATLYAQLFGAQRGSFPGAESDLNGLIEAAHGGTLFLDELGEMSADVQKELLRFLDSYGEYHRLGESETRFADVQIVCASHHSLDDPAYRSQCFREDLWYRLASSVIILPPLRERPDDIRAFLYSRRLPGGGMRVSEALSDDALAAIVRDPWPRNFHDLEYFVARLPAADKHKSLDRTLCDKLIQQIRPHGFAANAAVGTLTTGQRVAPLSEAELHALELQQKSSQAPTESPLESNAKLGWDRILQTALNAFLEDHREAQAGWDQLHLLVEQYLKPMFIAQATGAAQPGAAGSPVNYPALAHRLHIADGSTVKAHLNRFEERFAAGSLATDLESGTLRAKTE